MLILFDIDSTLITTGGVGVRAMGNAGRGRFGPTFDERRVEYAGRLDPLIIADLLRAHDIEVTPESIDAFRSDYGRELDALFQDNPGIGAPCPGVPTLLDALAHLPDATLGLLTGNFPETGAAKLIACGLDPERFAVRVWASDATQNPPARDHLPPVAMSRYEALRGPPIPSTSVVIIGDTPHDIACARAHGCRSLGVATGRFSRTDLEDAGADIALDTLAQTDFIVRWITEPAPV